MNKVIYYRKLLKLRQADLSKILGISTQGFSYKERGERAFTDKEKITLRDFFSKELQKEITIDELFF